MFDLTKKTRSFIVEERDVTTILMIINQICSLPEYRVGSCGWADMHEKWFIMFHATDKHYGAIIKKLKNIGDFKVDVRPGGQVDLVFERGS